MKEDIKTSVVFASVFCGLICALFGIVAIIEFNKIQEKCNYLEKQIEQQTMLIEYLKGKEK